MGVATLAKHISYHLEQGHVEILKNLTKWHKESLSLSESDLIVRVRQAVAPITSDKDLSAQQKAGLKALSTEVYTPPKHHLPPGHFLERSGNIISRILSFLDHDEIRQVAKAHVVLKQQASFAFLEVVRTKLRRKDVSVKDLLSVRGLQGFSLFTALSFFPKECSEVHTLELDSNIDMQAISECFPNVITVDFSNCTMEEICEYLKYSFSIKSIICWNIGNKIFLKTPVNLERISFESKSKVTLRGLEFFLKRSKCLKEVFFSSECSFQEAFLQMLGQHCPLLIKVSVYGKQLKDKSFLELTSGCPLLESLDLSGCRGLTEEGFFNAIKICKQIKTLNLSSCGWVTNSLIINLAHIFQDLTDFAIGDFKNLEDASLEVLAQNCPNLRVLYLTACTNITDKGLIALSKGCKELRELSLLRCDKITDSSIDAIAEFCPSLKVLKLNDCSSITNQSLKALSRCGALEILDLSNCQKIDNEGIAEIARGCRKMQEIVVPATVKRRGMIALLIGCPDAKQKILKYDAFHALCYRMEIEYPAKSSLGMLYQMVLQARPLHEIRRFLQKNSDLKTYTIEAETWPPIDLYLKMNQDLTSNYQNHRNSVEIDQRIRQLSHTQAHWENNFVILADALAEQLKS